MPFLPAEFVGGLCVQEVPLNNERQPDLQQGVIACCSAIHQSVERNSLRYFEELRRHNYVSLLWRTRLHIRCVALHARMNACNIILLIRAHLQCVHLLHDGICAYMLPSPESMHILPCAVAPTSQRISNATTGHWPLSLPHIVPNCCCGPSGDTCQLPRAADNFHQTASRETQGHWRKQAAPGSWPLQIAHYSSASRGHAGAIETHQCNIKTHAVTFNEPQYDVTPH